MTLSHIATKSAPRHLEPGDVCNVELSIRILDPSTVKLLNQGIEQLDDILVLRVENGRDHFIPVRGKWTESSLGRSIDKLIRIPEGGIRKLQHQKPKGSKGRDSSGASEELPVKWSAPRELFRLTEAVETLTEACVAEWYMISGDQKPPWHAVAGWPFAEESWNNSDWEQRTEGMLAVCDALDTDSSIVSNFDPETPKLQRLESLAAFFVDFLRSMPDGVITEDLWQHVEAYMTKLDHDRAKIEPEDQRTSLQELLSSSPPHSITFILMTSMLDRMVQELATGGGQSAVTEPRMPARTGSMRRRNFNKDPDAAFRQMTCQALAAVLGEAMIRAPTPTKEKDKTILQDRKIKFMTLFLTSAGT